MATDTPLKQAYLRRIAKFGNFSADNSHHGLKSALLATLILAGLSGFGSVLGATALSETELEGVTGGGIDTASGAPSLPQDPQQPETNNTNHTMTSPIDNRNGLTLDPEIFTIMQSSAKVDFEKTLRLSGMTQQNANSLNLENLLASDVVATNNILNGDSLSLNDVSSEIEINQVNDLEQRHRSQGELTSSIAGYQYETSALSRSGSESYDYLSYSYVDQDRVNEFLSVNTRGNSSMFGESYKSLEDMREGGIITGIEKGLLELLQFNVGNLDLSSGLDIKGDGSIIDSSPGTFHLQGTANLRFCFIWCIDVEVDLITINETIDIVGPEMKFISADSGSTDILIDKNDELLDTKFRGNDIAESTFSESYEHSIFIGGQMTGAEAELLALSESSLSVENSSMVSMIGSSQQNMRVFNGVNAVSSIAANALNISRLPVMTAANAGIMQISMQQQNLFTQQR